MDEWINIYYLYTMELYSFETVNEIMFTEMEVTGDHYAKQSKTYHISFCHTYSLYLRGKDGWILSGNKKLFRERDIGSR